MIRNVAYYVYLLGLLDDMMVVTISEGVILLLVVVEELESVSVVDSGL